MATKPNLIHIPHKQWPKEILESALGEIKRGDIDAGLKTILVNLFTQRSVVEERLELQNYLEIERALNRSINNLPAPSAVSGLGVFGDGSDGVVNFDGSTTVLGLAPASNVYTLTRDIYLYNGSQLSGSAVIKTVGFRIFCSGTLTIGASAKITDNGDDSVAGSGIGGQPPSGSFYASGSAGGGGGFGNGAGGNSITTAGIGGVGGTGGTGPGTTGGVGGAITAPLASAGGYPRNLVQALTGFPSSSVQYRGGSGGGGGGGQNGTGPGNGGGAGGGGGILGLFTQTIVNSGSVQAQGGNGSAGWNGGTGAGGGGGGGGGAILLITTSSSYGTFSVAGGSGGAGTGSGTAGATGAAGRLIVMNL